MSPVQVLDISSRCALCPEPLDSRILAAPAFEMDLPTGGAARYRLGMKCMQFQATLPTIDEFREHLVASLQFRLRVAQICAMKAP